MPSDRAENGVRPFLVVRYFLDEYSPFSYLMLGCLFGMLFFSASLVYQPAKQGDVVPAFITWGAVVAFLFFYVGLIYADLRDEATGGEQ